jgi:hypothetical protein
MVAEVKVHFTRDDVMPVCAAGGRNPSTYFVLTQDKSQVTCGRRECQREAGAPETYQPWRDDYED